MVKGTEKDWRVDKHIPVAWLIGIAIQTMALAGSGIWFAAKLTSKVDENTARIIAIQSKNTHYDETSLQAVTDIIQLEADVRVIKQSVQRIERKLDNMPVPAKLVY